jgi:tetratricopeptide (TPR) repeat protein
MATYKKRGYKPNTKSEAIEALEQSSTTAGVFNTLDETASKTEMWVIKNQRYIYAIVATVAIVVLGFLGYRKFISEPLDAEASNELYAAQQLFDTAFVGSPQDSLLTLALEGEDSKSGMLGIIENYGGTDSANLANYYAGVLYLNLKDYPNAIKYLSDFNTDDLLLDAIAKGAIGDAFVQLDQLNEGLDYYIRAVESSDNDFTSPMFLSKAGQLALQLDKADLALTYFERIKNEFPSSTEASTIDVLLGKASALVK